MTDMSPGLTPIEWLHEIHGCREQTSRRALGSFGLGGQCHTKPIGSLSGGERARVQLAHLFLLQPHILVLDEPTNHLDIDSVAALAECLQSLLQ